MNVTGIVLGCCVAAFAVGCASSARQDGPSGTAMVQAIDAYRAARASGDLETARSLMSDDPRRWWGEREGEGRPWTVSGEPGRWSGWDKHFASESSTAEPEIGERQVSFIVTEINDYYRLTERGPQQNRQTWYFDDAGRIEGWSIVAIRDADSYGRVDEFVAWAREHDPDELDSLMPDGTIDPTGDRPARMRTLLNAWRESVGLEPIQ